MKLLIVDDEVIERTSIRMVIERHMPEVEIVGEAENGRVALQLIDELKPDIVTLDIKMPGMDGIQVIEQLQTAKESTRFIMLSAYDQFDFARKVMKYGVKEYLVKPCKPEQMIHAIQATFEDIKQSRLKDEEVAYLQKNMQDAQLLMESELIANIVMDQIHAVNFAQWRNLLKAQMINGACTIVISVDDHNEDLDYEGKQALYHFLRQVVKESCSCMIGPMVGKLIVIFVFPKDEVSHQRFSARSYSIQLARRLMQRFDRYQQPGVIRIGIGRLYNEVDELVKSYHEALISLQYNDTQKINIYDDLNIVQKRDEELIRQKNLEQSFLRAIRQGEQLASLELFEQYMKQVMKLTKYNIKLVRYELHKLFTLVNYLASDNGLELQLNIDFELFETENQMIEHAKRQLSQIVLELNCWFKVDHKGSLALAKQYIDEHYNKDLNLEEVANQVQLNPYYFSKLFHEKNGVTFIDYITGLRIEKAKEMLIKNNISLKNISIDVGYRDPNYFSRVFKKVVGISPSDYRTQLHKSGFPPFSN